MILSNLKSKASHLEGDNRSSGFNEALKDWEQSIAFGVLTDQPEIWL